MFGALSQYFYEHNTQKYAYDVKQQQQTHFKFQNRIKTQFINQVEEELLTEGRFNSTFNQRNSSLVRQVKNTPESAILNSGPLTALNANPTTFSNDVDESIPSFKNEELSKLSFRNFTRLEDSNEFGISTKQNGVFPDPVAHRIQWIAGARVGFDFLNSRPNFNSHLEQVNQKLSNSFISSETVSNRISTNQTASLDVTIGAELTPWLEVQTGIQMSQTLVSSRTLLLNTYLEEYTFVESIVTDEYDDRGNFTYTTIQREEERMDTITTNYRNQAVNIPVSVLLKKDFGGITGFVSAGVLINLFESTSIRSTSQLFDKEVEDVVVESFSRNQFRFGIGGEYTFLQNLSLRVEPTLRITPGQVNQIDQQVGATNLGLNAGLFYRF